MNTVLKVNPFFDIIKTDSFYLILDHLTPRQIKMKFNPMNLAVFDVLKRGCHKEELLIATKEKMKENFDETLYTQFISMLEELKVLEHDETNCGLVTEDEQKRFQYQLDWLAVFGTSHQSRHDFFRRIRNSTVALVGVGGVGSNLAALFAAAGIGKLILIDSDVVEESNLVRQIFYKERQVGKTKKVDALEEYLEEFSSFTTIKKIPCFVHTVTEIESAVSGADIIIQTADTPTVVLNRNINQVCIMRKIPYLYAFNMGIGPFFIPGETACFYCLEKFAIQESRGMHNVIAEHLSSLRNRKFPSFVGGPWNSAYYLFMEAFHFLAKTKRTGLANRMLKFESLYETRFVNIPRIEECMCGRTYE